MFYAGYLSWQRIGEFCAAQGFDEVHGGGAIDRGRSGNEWGVEDEALFAYVEQHLPADRPSFNVIITTSYHPPFNVDVRSKGFALQVMPPSLAPLYDGRTSLVTFGHLWYSDRAAARFIGVMDQRLPTALFALTAARSCTAKSGSAAMRSRTQIRNCRTMSVSLWFARMATKRANSLRGKNGNARLLSSIDVVYTASSRNKDYL